MNSMITTPREICAKKEVQMNITLQSLLYTISVSTRSVAKSERKCNAFGLHSSLRHSIDESNVYIYN